jgi:hypothetical protein
VDCLRHLKSIVDRSGAQIVLSTSWRLESHSLELLLNMLYDVGITRAQIVGRTPDGQGQLTRGIHLDLLTLFTRSAHT